MSLRTMICKMFQPMRCLECIFSILLLADLDSMSLGYLFYPYLQYLLIGGERERKQYMVLRALSRDTVIGQ